MTIDYNSVYWVVVLEQNSSFLTTFKTPYGCYCFLRLQCGVVSTVDVFSSKVDGLFEDIPGTYPVMDDLTVQGKTEVDMI